MIKSIKIFLAVILLSGCSSRIGNESISFFEVPLVCGAAPEIGCGSRIKPLFIDLEKESSVKEAWTNRDGTIIAIKWANKPESTKELDALFDKHSIKADYISEKKTTDSLVASIAAGDGWLKGMAVDSLSLYEAGVIAHTLTDFARKADLINENEHELIRKDLEAYFKKELVKVRTEKELTSEECQENWRRNGFAIYQSHIGKERAEAVSKYFDKNEIEIMKQESYCSEDEEYSDKKQTSTITCPHCGHKKIETMPTDVCLGKYTCESCKKILTTKDGDCCVFCSYGDHKCPSMQ